MGRQQRASVLACILLRVLFGSPDQQLKSKFLKIFCLIYSHLITILFNIKDFFLIYINTTTFSKPSILANVNFSWFSWVFWVHYHIICKSLTFASCIYVITFSFIIIIMSTIPGQYLIILWWWISLFWFQP